MTMTHLETWLEGHSMPLVRAVRHQRRWYVVLSDRRTERTGNASTLDAALAHAAGLVCEACAEGTCDRW